MNVPLPANESERLRALRALNILDTLPHRVFDHVTELAAAICGTPIALLSLVDTDRQWFKARLGLAVSETARDAAFCAHTILDQRRVLVVPDARTDDRFADLPLVRDEGFTFYAGAPIVTPDGHALGAVCVLDRRSRQLSEGQVEQLRHLAALAMDLIANESVRRTEARLILDQVQRNEQVIRDVLDQGHDMAAYLDREHRFLFVNPAFEAHWGLPRDAIVGMHLHELVGRRLYDDTLAPALNRALAGESSSVAYDHDFPGAGPRSMEVRYVPARGDDGAVRGVVERHRDVTDLRHQADELRGALADLQRSEAIRRKFLQALSHDLREPVNAINNAVPVLQDRGVTDPLEARCLDYVARGGRRLARLLDDLRLLGEQDLRGWSLRPVPLAPLWHDAVQGLADELGGRDVVVDVPPALVVRADPAMLTLALRAILLHAHRASRFRRTPLAVLAQPGGPDVLCRVLDQERAEPLPDPAALRARAAACAGDRAFEGLTLATAAHVVRGHGGLLAYEHDHGRVQRFLLALPGGDDHAA